MKVSLKELCSRLALAVGMTCLMFAMYYAIGYSYHTVLPDNNMLLTFFVDATVIAAGILFRKKLPPIHEEKRPEKKTVLTFAGILFFMSVSATITSAYIVNVIGDEGFETYEKSVTSAAEYGVWGQIAMFVLSCAFAPVTEEIMFRGIVYRYFRSVHPAVAYLVSSFLFAAMHGTKSHLFIAFFGGLIIARAYELTGSLKWSAAAHAFYNIMASTAGFLIASSLPVVKGVVYPLNLVMIVLTAMLFFMPLPVKNCTEQKS